MPAQTSGTGLSPFTGALSSAFPSPAQRATFRSYNPQGALPRLGFGLFPGRSPLLGESFIYFLFLQVLRCFSSLR